MMMIAAGREEGCLRAVSLRELEPKHTVIKADRPLKVSDLEVDMANPDGRMDETLRHARLSPSIRPWQSERIDRSGEWLGPDPATNGVIEGRPH